MTATNANHHINVSVVVKFELLCGTFRWTFRPTEPSLSADLHGDVACFTGNFSEFSFGTFVFLSALFCFVTRVSSTAFAIVTIYCVLHSTSHVL